jgi:hypothetical protein
MLMSHDMVRLQRGVLSPVAIPFDVIRTAFSPRLGATGPPPNVTKSQVGLDIVVEPQSVAAGSDLSRPDRIPLHQQLVLLPD